MIIVVRKPRKRLFIYMHFFSYRINCEYDLLHTGLCLEKGDSTVINIGRKLNYILQNISTSQAFNITVRLSTYFHVLTSLNDSQS